jgi:hypothetical protein
MQPWQVIAIGVVIIIVVAAVGWLIYQRNRTQHLKDRFGSEYDRRVTEFGNRSKAESELERAEARVKNLKVRELSASDRTRFLDEWRLCQARFVDDPAGAVNEADRVLTDIMRTRGYAVDDPYSRTTDITAAYPNHASAYREANEIVVRHRRGHSSTEDLRKAFINFRALFDEILGGADEKLRRVS